MSLPTFNLILTIAVVIIILDSKWVSSTTEFVFNTNFNSSDLLLVGDSTIQSSIISLYNATDTYSTGRALYHSRIPTRLTNSSTMLPFSTSFIFSSSVPLYPNRDWAFAFVFFAYFRYTRFEDNWYARSLQRYQLLFFFFSILFGLLDTYPFYYLSSVGLGGKSAYFL